LYVFFYAIENKLSKKYSALFKGGTGKGSARLTGLHWHILRYDIGESGIFNKQGMTPFDSVGRENLHNVLRYANTRAIQADERIKATKGNRVI
jgi:hypothetical protein